MSWHNPKSVESKIRRLIREIAANLHATVVGVQWVVESHDLFWGALILVGSRASDRYMVRLHGDHNSVGTRSRWLADRACLLALGFLFCAGSRNL
jgi:hypothetical protein